MTFAHDATRRSMMAAIATLQLGGAAAAVPSVGARTLVVYFSRSGNTRVVAGLLHRTPRAVGTDLFEIRPASPYPEDYHATVARARKERDSGDEPALAAKVLGIANYDTVFLGFPIWGETAPPVIRSFLSAHDLAGKTLIPFVTHGGYGLGNSQAVLARHAPKARLLKGFVMEADQERRTVDSVTGWLSTVPTR